MPLPPLLGLIPPASVDAESSSMRGVEDKLGAGNTEFRLRCTGLRGGPLGCCWGVGVGGETSPITTSIKASFSVLSMTEVRKSWETFLKQSQSYFIIISDKTTPNNSENRKDTLL